MKCTYLAPILILLPLYAFSNPQNDFTLLTQSQEAAAENTNDVLYTSESERSYQMQKTQRNNEFPTQIVRIKSAVIHHDLSCKQIHDHINKILIEHIAIKEKFDYAIYVNCRYDPETLKAIEFNIESYFDPLTDQAINEVTDYINTYNGMDLFGTPFKIEAAKGLVISLNFATGIKNKPNKPPFIQYRKDRSTFYFKSNYEMKRTLFADIYENFYSNDPEHILPFLDKWIFMNAGSIYKAILRDSNYAEIEPERIFLMDNGEELFVSGLKQYFTNYCQKYENHHCLKAS